MDSPLRILLAMILVVFSAGWLLGRSGSRWGGRLTSLAGIAVRVVAALVIAYVAVVLAGRGGLLFWALAVVLGVVAALSLAFSGLSVWVLVRFRDET